MNTDDRIDLNVHRDIMAKRSVCGICVHQSECDRIILNDCYYRWLHDRKSWYEFQNKGQKMNTDGIKQESGEKREFATGAKRQAALGKGTPSLFPADAYIEICKHFEAGAVLHGARNWEKGLPISCFIDSLERHIAAIKMGKTDEEHFRAAAWNAVCMLATKVRIEEGILPKELDDMPEYRRIVGVNYRGTTKGGESC